MLIKASDLRLRDVINTIDGRRLGTISDVEFDLENGRIKAIVVPGSSRFLWFLRKEDDVVIPWNRIKKIGEDVILVEAVNYSEPDRTLPEK
jgi:YlmC/YmxH family sporulation protein